MDFVDRSFVNQLEPFLDRFKERGDDYNFRCPCCGDSRKSETKARGWLRWSTEHRNYRYSCYNCSESLSLTDLIRLVRPNIVDAYIAEKFKSVGRRDLADDRATRAALTHKPVFATVAAPPPPPAPVDPLLPPLPRFPEVKRILEVDWAMEYAASRRIPFEELTHIFATESLLDVSRNVEAYKETRFPRVRSILFPYYSVDRRLEYLQARTLTGDLRYVTFEIAGGGKLWGRHRIDPAKRVFMFEGVLDALFVANGAASGGVDLIRAGKIIREEYPGTPISLCYDADWTVNADVYDQVIRAERQGFDVTFTRGPGKDINDLVVKHNWTGEMVQAMLDANTFSGLKAKLEISREREPIGSKRRNWKWKLSTRTT